MTHLQLKGVVPGLVVGTSTCAYCASSGTRIQNFKNKQCLKFSLLLSGQKLQHIHAKRPLFPMLGHSTQEIFGSGNREAWKQLIGIQSGIQTFPCASCFQLAVLVSNPSEQPQAFITVRRGKQVSQGLHVLCRGPKHPHCLCKILSYPMDVTLVPVSIRDTSSGQPSIVPNILKYSLPVREELQQKFYQI